MARTMFLNLPVKNLGRTVAFFRQLGFEFNATFSDERAACMVISDEAFVMLLVEDFYATFTTKPVADTATSNEVIVAISAESREEVDELVNRAIAAGGAKSKDPIDDGPMYGWSFADLDGHLWEVIYMDPSALQQ